MPRAKEILASLAITIAGLGALFGTIYLITLYPIIGAAIGALGLLALLTWLVHALVYAPANPNDNHY